jgi:hypothetical protein
MIWQVMSVREEEQLPMHSRDPRDYLPDIRDGLTHREPIVLQCLYDLQQERGGRNVPTGMLYGSVVEHVDMSVEEMQSILVLRWKVVGSLTAYHPLPFVPKKRSSVPLVMGYVLPQETLRNSAPEFDAGGEIMIPTVSRRLGHC